MQALVDAAEGRGLDYNQWPDLLQLVIRKIDHAISNEFPPVKIPVPGPVLSSSQNFTTNGEPGVMHISTPPPRSPPQTNVPVTPQPPAGPSASEADRTTVAAATTTTASSSASDPTEPSSPAVVPNSQPPGPDSEATPARPPASSATTSPVATGAAMQNATSVETPPGTLPPPLAALYEQIQGALHGPFGTVPPYTYQRLAELVIEPRRHYKTLPAYLRALDRVLSVSSPANVYPLKVETGNVSQGVAGAPMEGFMATSSNHSDISMHEGFNGAELTRIPWIQDMQDEGSEDVEDVSSDARRDTTDRAGGDPSRDVVDQRANSDSASGYSTGQRTTLVNGMSRSVPADSAVMHEVEDNLEQGMNSEDMTPHARGPQEIGNEDIGPQHADHSGMPGIVDLEAAVGRPGEGEVVPGSGVHVPEQRSRTIENESLEAMEEGEQGESSNHTDASESKLTTDDTSEGQSSSTTTQPGQD